MILFDCQGSRTTWYSYAILYLVGTDKRCCRWVRDQSKPLGKRKEHESESKQSSSVLTEDQKLIKKLQKELKDAQMERDILKDGWASFLRETGDIRIIKDY